MKKHSSKTSLKSDYSKRDQLNKNSNISSSKISLINKDSNTKDTKSFKSINSLFRIPKPGTARVKRR